MLTDDNKKEILTNFIIDNPDLDNLESMLSAFNVFEAVGMIRQEIRHSHFLAFLLNPSESHRLSDLLVKRFLICVLANTEEPPINPLEIDLADLDDLEVRQEWNNIDILLISPNNSIVCAIENKVDSDEHSDQLERYKEIIDKEFLNYQKLFIYLTKDGKFPAKEEDKKNWLTFSYGEIAQIIETILNKYQSTIGDDVYTIMNHYVNLIRRHLMSESDIAQLCRKIYKQHKQAIDLIYENLPNLQSDIKDFLIKMINNTQNLTLNRCSKKDGNDLVRFSPQEWDNLPFQESCTDESWLGNQGIISFEFENSSECLNIILTIGRSNTEVKQAILDKIEALSITGKNTNKKLSSPWNRIWKQEILKKSDYLEFDLEELQAKVTNFWETFTKQELKSIREAICEISV